MGLGARGCAGNYAYVMKIPLVLGQGNKLVPAVIGMEVLVGIVEIRCKVQVGDANVIKQ